VLRAVWKALSGIFGIAGVLSTLAGAADQAGVSMIFPAWAWWLIAITCLAILAVRQQLQLDQSKSASVRRIERQSFVTFREIAEVVSEAEAYSADEIIERLRVAALNNEFVSCWGKNRLLITEFDKDQRVKRRVSFDYAKREDMGDPGTAIYEAAMLYDKLTDDTGGADGRVTLSQRDFARWLRRFESGRYER
jgi:hypothetical protein